MKSTSGTLNERKRDAPRHLAPLRLTNEVDHQVLHFLKERGMLDRIFVHYQ